MNKQLPGIAGMMVFAAALFVTAPRAQAQVALGLPPTWRVEVTGTASTKAAGRDDFVEYVYIEQTSFSGDQICKLGMEQQSLNVTLSLVPGTYNVSCTMRSTNHGTISFSGTINNTLMQGTLSWTTGGKTYSYNYRGVPFTPDPNAES